MNIWEHPAVIGIIVAIPSFVLGVLSWRRSLEVDDVAEKAGAASQEIGAVQQVIDGLNRLVASLQEDNKVLRQEIAELRAEVKRLSDGWKALEAEVRHLEGRGLSTATDIKEN